MQVWSAPTGGQAKQQVVAKANRSQASKMHPSPHAVLHMQSERQLSGWTAYGKVTPAARVDALARPDATHAALADPATNRLPQSNAPRTLCILRHCRKHPGTAAGASGRGTFLAQNAEQPELASADLVEEISADQGAVSVAATKAVSPLLGAASYRHAVKQLLTSVVREICTLRSVGAAARATAPGHPVGRQQWLSLRRSPSIRSDPFEMRQGSHHDLAAVLFEDTQILPFA
jgi:hypothetical protein